MEVTDAVGQKTEIALRRPEAQSGFAAGTFSYTPAKGVDVVSGN
jgi:outer membrane lipoprotein carrier protein